MLKTYFMELFISGELTINEVNKNFQKYFPYLKLEFYNCDFIPGQTALWQDSLVENTRLSNVVVNMPSAIIEFGPTDSVTELEQKFLTQLGLFVRVYRNIDGVWQETVRSGQLELDKQNALGKLSFKHSYNKYTLFL